MSTEFHEIQIIFFARLLCLDSFSLSTLWLSWHKSIKEGSEWTRIASWQDVSTASVADSRSRLTFRITGIPLIRFVFDILVGDWGRPDCWSRGLCGSRSHSSDFRGHRTLRVVCWRQRCVRNASPGSLTGSRLIGNDVSDFAFPPIKLINFLLPFSPSSVFFCSRVGFLAFFPPLVESLCGGCTTNLFTLFVLIQCLFYDWISYATCAFSSHLSALAAILQLGYSELKWESNI